MASPETIAAGGTGNTGSLAGDTLFYIEERIDLSTDGGTTYMPFERGTYLTVKSGLTVHWRNPNAQAVTLRYMVI